MTVTELIAILQRYPPDVPVVVAGFEGDGYSDVGTVEHVQIFDTHFVGHAGRYQKDDELGRRENPGKGDGFEAIFIA